MSVTGASQAGTRRSEDCTAPAHDPLGERRYADPDKAAVMVQLRQLVRAGRASWSAMSRGDIALTLSTGEVFHLGEASITRLV